SLDPKLLVASSALIAQRICLLLLQAGDECNDRKRGKENSTSENVIDSENMIKLAPDTANSKGARKAAKKAKPARVPRQRPVLVGPFLIASRSDGKRSRGNA